MIPSPPVERESGGGREGEKEGGEREILCSHNIQNWDVDVH